MAGAASRAPIEEGRVDLYLPSIVIESLQ